jgi:hypothetical protein
VEDVLIARYQYKTTKSWIGVVVGFGG